MTITSDQLLSFAATLVLLGGAVGVLGKYVFGPLLKGLRLIEKLVADVADLIKRVGGLEEKVEAVDVKVDKVDRDLAEVKGALKAVGLLPGGDD